MHGSTDTPVSDAADNGPYSAREAATILRLSERTVRRAIARGELAASKRGGVFRRGLWPGSRPKRWDVYPELTAERQGASDHAAVWVDLDI